MINTLTVMDLKTRQRYPLELKVEMSKVRIREFYRHYHGKVYVAYSGGPDSGVLLDMVRSEYPNVIGLFIDTKLEFPEIRQFVRKTPNIEWRVPKMRLHEVIKKYGYPVISKEVSMAINRYRNAKPDSLRKSGLSVKEYRLNGEIVDGKKMQAGTIPKKWHFVAKGAPFKISEQCCDILKKQPLKKFQRETGLKPYIGTMATDSNTRAREFQKRNCNIYDGGTPQSNPLAFWNKTDIWEYVARNDLEYCNIYNKGYHNTGCVPCPFGIHMESKPNRYDLLKKTHPKYYNYSMDKLGFREVLNFIGVN